MLYNVKYGITLIIFLISMLISGCQQKSKKESLPINNVHITPTPNKILYKRGYFELTKSTRILLNLSVKEQELRAEELINLILIKTGHKLKISDKFTTNKIHNSIDLEYKDALNLIPGSFELKITSNKIEIAAGETSGFTYAFNLLISLMEKKNNTWQIPQIFLEDKPAHTSRALELNIPLEATSTKLISELIGYRINYLFIQDGDTVNSKNTELSIFNKNEINNILNTPISKASTISQLAAIADKNKTGSIVYSINSNSQLSSDSLRRISEIMWSEPKSFSNQE